MSFQKNCAVVIPCRNEAATIASLVENVRRFVPSVFVVDDGSTDATGESAQRAGAEVLRHDQARGKGTALQTGWQRALELGFKWALTMDGDGQHAPEDIPKFFACVEKTSADLVIGNRMDSAEKMPRVRRFVNRWMSKKISRLANQSFPDSQCGFRLISLDALAATPVRAERFEIESEVLLLFALAGRKIEFVPIQVIYKNERSKIRPLGDTLRWFRWWRRARKVNCES
jgi:glycosyltransferase involved in cell wall biosynthesis